MSLPQRSGAAPGAEGGPVSDPVHDYRAEIGRKGGAAGRGPAKARTSEQARKVALARWGKRKAKAREPAWQHAKRGGGGLGLRGTRSM